MWVRLVFRGSWMRSEDASDVITVPKAAVTFEDPTEDKGTVMVVDDASVAHAKQKACSCRARGDGDGELAVVR